MRNADNARIFLVSEVAQNFSFAACATLRRTMIKAPLGLRGYLNTCPLHNHNPLAARDVTQSGVYTHRRAGLQSEVMNSVIEN